VKICPYAAVADSSPPIPASWVFHPYLRSAAPGVIKDSPTTSDRENVCRLNRLPLADIKWVKLELAPATELYSGTKFLEGFKRSGNRKNLQTVFFQIHLPRGLGAERARVQAAGARCFTHILAPLGRRAPWGNAVEILWISGQFPGLTVRERAR
jgi:hypothetical protein